MSWFRKKLEARGNSESSRPSFKCTMCEGQYFDTLDLLQQHYLDAHTIDEGASDTNDGADLNEQQPNNSDDGSIDVSATIHANGNGAGNSSGFETADTISLDDPQAQKATDLLVDLSSPEGAPSSRVNMSSGSAKERAARQIVELESEVDEWKTRYKEEHYHNQQLETALTKTQNELLDLQAQQQASTANSELRHLRRENTQLKSHLEDVEQELNAATTEKTALQQALDMLTREMAANTNSQQQQQQQQPDAAQSSSLDLASPQPSSSEDGSVRLQELQAQIASLQSDLDEKQQTHAAEITQHEQTVADLQTRLDTTLSERDSLSQRLEQDKADYERQLTELRTLHDKALSARDNLVSELKTASDSEAALQRQLDDGLVQLKVQTEALSAAKATLATAEDDLAAKGLEIDSLRESNERLSTQLAQSQSDKDALLANINADSNDNDGNNDTLTLALEQAKAEADATEARVNDLTSQLTELKASLSQSELESARLLQEVAEGQTQIEALQAAKNELTEALDKTKSKSEAETNELRTKLTELQGEQQGLQQQLETAQSTTEDLRSQMRDLSTELEAAAKSLSHEQAASMQARNKLESELKEVREREGAANEKASSLAQEVEQLKADLESKHQASSDHEERVQNLQLELVEAKEELTAANLKIKQQIETLDNKAEENQVLRDRLSERSELEEQAMVRMQKQEEVTNQLLMQVSKAQEMLAFPCESCKQYEQQLQTAKTSHKALQEQHNATANELEDAQNKLLAVEARATSLTEELEQTQVKTAEDKAALAIEFQTVQSQVEQLTQQTNKLQTERDQLGQSLEESKAEAQLAMDELTAMQAEHKELSAQNQQLQADLEQAQAAAASAAQDKDETLLLIEETKRIFVGQKLQVQKQLDVVSADLASERKANTSLKHELEQSTAKLQADLSASKEQNKLLAHTRSELEQELNTLQETSRGDQLKLQGEVNTLQETLMSVEQQMASTEKQLKAAQAEAEELRTTVVQMDADHTDLRSKYQELESTHSGTVSKLRSAGKNLKQTQAGLTAMAEENQALRMQIAKAQGREWKSDSEVSNCQGCNKGFGLTTRRHHCRNCGQVYCNDCSGRKAKLPSYKSPVRVCDACFKELA